MSRTVDVVFDGPPSAQAGRFIEVEDETGASVRVGQWINRGDGMWALRLELADPPIGAHLSERMRNTHAGLADDPKWLSYRLWAYKNFIDLLPEDQRDAAGQALVLGYEMGRRHGAVEESPTRPTAPDPDPYLSDYSMYDDDSPEVKAAIDADPGVQEVRARHPEWVDPDAEMPSMLGPAGPE